MPDPDDTNNPNYRNPDFVAELTPHRSLGRTGFIVLMAFVSITCFTAGIMFLVAGAWPVVFFLGIDVFIIWLAFRINYRSARAKEVVSVGRDQLRIEKTDPWGRTRKYVFNPFWSRFEVSRHEGMGITDMAIISNENRLQVGTFLNPVDRESFASAFSNALARAKGA